MLLFLESIPYITIFLFGITIGSFLNVCIYRIPEGESIITAPSHCMTCGTTLRKIDMIPILSWLMLGGKCRKCKTKISIQYPIIEFANGILYVIVCAVRGFTWDSLIYCLTGSALLTLSVIDWRTYEIPFAINQFLGVMGIAAAILDKGHLMEHLIGGVSVSGLLAILYLISGGSAIGGGDIKLMAASGLILGWKNNILAFILGCILGSVIHLIRMKRQGEGHVLAMGPYLSLGIMLAGLWGDRWISSYLKLFGI